MSKAPLATRIAFDDEDVNEIERVLTELHADDKTTVTGEGLAVETTIILALLTFTAFVNLVIRISQIWKCGLIVDCREKEITTQKSCDLPRGQVLVITRDGEKVTLDKPSEADLRSLLGGLR